jgi:hypothetical protein
LVAAESSDAAVVPFTPPGGLVVMQAGYLYYEFDINGDGHNDFDIYDQSYMGSFLLSYNSGSQFATNLIMNDGSLAAVVAPGATIGPDSSGWPNNILLDSFAGTRGFAGVVFDIPGGSPHFGYLDFELTADRSTLTLYGGAYESQANTPITTPVPEPGPLVLLASGAAGLAAWRRRRGNAATSSAD